MAKNLSLCLVVLLAVASAESTFLKTEGKALRFQAIGDQGFFAIPGSFTDGSPLFEQSDIDKANPIEVPNQVVADKMSKVAQEDPIDFVIGLGDNFYQLPNGLKNINDPRVAYMFSHTYNQPGLKVPFYMILGNHDCYGDPKIEVAETKIHEQWNMPNNYYEQTFDIDNGKKALFLFLDGCVLSCADSVKSGQTCNGFSYPITKDIVDAHLTWLEQTLEKYASDSTIAWRTISVHWPFFSIGHSHGDTDSLKNNVLPMLAKYKVDVILSGHDHNSQYINMTVDTITKGEVKPGNKSRSDCSMMPIGVEENKDTHFTQGEHVHQFGAGNSGVPPGQLCKSRYTEHENVIYAAWVNGFIEVEVSSKSYVVRNWAVHTNEYLTQITIDAAAPKVEEPVSEWEQFLTLFEQWFSSE
mmetsp:Transcript_18331/g.20798  ORF Transcript_18331/g.20798 Transcript_18331/m.20798 type:complete len:412 (-) Transcript_18331:208-1443(-)